MQPSHFITAWLTGSLYLKSEQYIDSEPYDIKSIWLNIDGCYSLDQAAEVKLVPFEQSRKSCFDYLHRACDLIGRERGRPNRINPETDGRKILDILGDPPFGSYSIYLITVSQQDGEQERVVYVGKTNATTNRFRAGHAAFSKLHGPKYEGLKKRIYFACVSAVNDDDHTFPAEWINPAEDREKILSSVEYQLIYELQTELNDRGLTRCLAEYPRYIVTQNTVGEILDATTFGNSYFQE
jgi:hypothetical protein